MGPTLNRGWPLETMTSELVRAIELSDLVNTAT